MIIKGKEVIGLNIVTIDSGSVVEHVDDIAYNPSTQRVEALLVSSGGLFTSAKAVHMDDVRNIGEDAVIIMDASVIKSVKDIDESVRSISDSNKHLVKTNVLTVDGKELGKVTDIFFDSATGNVDSMEVSQGSLKSIREGKKLIKPIDIVTIGADATIVSAYTESKFDAQAEENGLNGALNDIKDKASELTENTKSVARDTAQQTKAVAKDAVDTTKKKTAQFADSAQDKAQELNNKAKVKSSELQDEARVVANKAKDTASELSTKAKAERVNHAKDENNCTSSATGNKGSQVVEQAKEYYEDANKTVKVETSRTVIK